MKKVALISLGCAKNLVDSENILGLLLENHYQVTSDKNDAELLIINTCGFIEESKRESIEVILDHINGKSKVVVTGCLVNRYLDELKKEIPEVDLWIPLRDYPRFNALLRSLEEQIDNDEGINEKYRLVSTGPYSAYLKIGEGCSNRCSYCAIPLIRGPYVSRPYQNIIEEANGLVKQGYKELILIQQDTTRYGIDLKKGQTIVELLKGLLENKSLEFIRLLYLYPDEISDKLIDLIAKEERIMPYFDIPIQHSEDQILKAMNRRGNKEFLINLFRKIREKIPHAILRTTIIVGFPGETSKDFNNLLKFVESIKFDHLGAFKYSKEEDTPAFNYPHQVREATKERRLNALMTLQQNISYEQNKKHVGEIMKGLVIGQENGYYLLRSYFNSPDDVDGKILFNSIRPLNEGEIVRVVIKESYVYDLYGELVNDD
ncbi:MAG TPA: 30S ribosomal protein S12 methylthiotransferase RimO [Erysipelotrichaceae bacterium]|nr:30S ribosomal protein S12 methylthiotransferase RimO [Erysipelotrichaceae bacterium]